eukprot:gene26421-47735_t
MDMHELQHHTDPLAGLLGRYSVGTKHLAEPAPSLNELQRMTAAALRAPDHAGLVPFRFAAIRGGARGQLADLFEQAALLAGKGADEAARDRGRALDAPLLVAVIARIDPGHPVATLHEQWMAVGGALGNVLGAGRARGAGGPLPRADPEGLAGEPRSGGGRTPLAALDAAASGRMAVAEAITNLLAAPIELPRVKLSANWMAACGEPGEDAALYETVKAVGMELCPALGISIPVGKDSLSMRTQWKEGAETKKVTSPVSLIVSAFATLAD